MDKYPKGFFERKLKKGKCIVLLDGLDEVANKKTHDKVIDKIKQLVNEYPDNRYLVTCRIAGWDNSLPTFEVLEAKDFTRSEIQRFVYGWYKAVITKKHRDEYEFNELDDDVKHSGWVNYLERFVKPEIESRSKKLMNAIDENNRIFAIAKNPMLLSLISLVHYSNVYLPKGRTILYNRSIEQLIDAWNRNKNIHWAIDIDLSKKESLLRELAYDFHTNGKSEEKRRNIEIFIEKASNKLDIQYTSQKLLRDIELRSGLLIERSIDVLGFSHLTLQEHLVAQHISKDERRYKWIKNNIENPEWREVILLYSGLLEDATRIIKDIIQKGSSYRISLAAHCIKESKQVSNQTTKEILALLLIELDKQENEDILNALASIATDFKRETYYTSAEIFSKTD